MTGRLYLRTVLPIGVLYTVSLVCANLVYLYLSVSFIQMLKALAPVVTLLMSWAASLSTPRASALGNVLVIALGVAVAGLGEVEFSWVGFAVQCTSYSFSSFSFFSFFSPPPPPRRPFLACLARPL